MTSDATLLKRWPEHLIKQLTSGNFVLVVGAGVSQTCVNQHGERPPGWHDLLSRLAKEILTGAARKAVNELVKAERLLEGAELLRSRAKRVGKEEDFLHRVAELTDGGNVTAKQFQPSSVYEKLLMLEPDMIVTTNYDRVLERASKSGYNVHSFTSAALGRDVRSGNPAILKIHGSVDESTKIVLTRSDYSRLRRDGAHCLEVLQALFLTKTALFVGYGFGDPDIQLLLENVMGGRGDVAAHYLLASKAIPDHQTMVYEFCFGTTVIRYAAGDYGEADQMLGLLANAVQSRRAASV